ncbi:enoyl-CoA hydratase/isomerase family protein [Mesorhizobium sp. M3A.F.Ca.ET.080.04.2.1]|nr:enoyl-CoA hydratase/isomerase family protein [Mesorhizobium sp. M3A.F.Ca.ET.080.04.2.1]RWF21456.1 MAG: enoyl-CoA hydratase/isomerase family protein [Mesorhizobium sp.]
MEHVMQESYGAGQVICEIEDETVFIGLNSPRSLNAMDPVMVSGIVEATEDAARSGHRWIVLHGKGENFSSGASLDGYQDLVESVSPGPDSGMYELIASERGLTDLARILRHPHINSIAAVHGWVIGQALEIALACDYVVAAPDAIFWLPETQHGWNVGMGATYLLTHTLGLGWARRMLLLNEKLPAARAEQLGLVSRIAADNDIRAESLKLINQLRKSSPMALQFQKKLLDILPSMSLDDSREMEIMTAYLLASTHDPREAMTAFRAGRAPNYAQPRTNNGASKS